MESNKSTIINFLKEVSVVVIGVLIAVSIGNFKENRDNEKYIKKTLTAIESEINQNEIEVETVLKRHLEIIVAFKEALQNDNESLRTLIMRLGGIQSPDIKNIGLRFFISNKAELVDYQIISQLSDVENSANLLNEKMKRMIDFMYDNISEKDENIKAKFMYLLDNVINSEKGLLNQYEIYKNEN